MVTIRRKEEFYGGKEHEETDFRRSITVVCKNGYLGTSMNDIARQLGVTKAALYKHYTSKQEILDSIVNRMDSLDYERGKSMKCHKETAKP